MLCIITPTYNERENIKMLVEKVFSLGVPNAQMIIVDDNSPDGTGRIAEEMQKQYPITVIHQEEKKGLGRAYVEAFKYILALPAERKPDVIVQIDADLSHDPSVISEMLKEIQTNDVVIGSRYTQGGRIKNWNVPRRLLSWFGNVYARIILRLPYHDLTAGFMCYRREVLEHMDIKTLNSIGYNFQIETKYRAYHMGAAIQEIPITFTERRKGASKIDIFIIVESFFKVLLLPFGSRRRFRKMVKEEHDRR